VSKESLEMGRGMGSIAKKQKNKPKYDYLVFYKTFIVEYC